MKPAFPRILVIIVLPVFYLVLSFIYLSHIKQFSIYNNDPSYCYLMNGTNLASGHFRVGIVEHPGTPVECFAAGVIFVKHLFNYNTILYQDVLLHAESYLFTCSIILTLLLALSTFLAAKLVYKHTGNMDLALLFQSAPLFFGDIVKMTISLSAESFIVIYGIYFMAYLYVNTIHEKATTNKNLIFFGLFSALLITTKMYCAPIMLLVMFMIGKRKQIAVYLIATSVFGVILLFPLYNQLRNIAGWIKSMLFHKGFYGKGDPGIINTSSHKDSLIDIFTRHYLFTSVLVIVLVAFIITLFGKFKKKSENKDFFLPVSGILIFLIAFIVIIAKQYIYYYPAPLTHQVMIITKFYYFIIVFVSFPLAIAVSYKILSQLALPSFIRQHKQKLFYVGFMILMTWGGSQSYAECSIIPHQNELSDKTRPFLDSLKGTPLIIVTDGFKVCDEEAYFLGISYSGRWDAPTYFDFMKKMEPDSYIYTSYNDVLSFGINQLIFPPY